MDDFRNIQPGDIVQTANRKTTGVVLACFPAGVTRTPSLKVQRRDRRPAVVPVASIATVWRREAIEQPAEH